MEDDLIEHIIDVDEYISITLKIPKVLTPMGLKALTVKANKLFNLSEVPLVDSKKRQYGIRNGISNEEKIEYIKKYDESDREGKERIATELGVLPQSLYSKISAFRLSVSDAPKHYKKRKNKPNKNNLLTEYENAITSRDKEALAKKYGLTIKKLYRKINYMKHGK